MPRAGIAWIESNTSDETWSVRAGACAGSGAALAMIPTITAGTIANGRFISVSGLGGGELPRTWTLSHRKPPIKITPRHAEGSRRDRSSLAPSLPGMLDLPGSRIAPQFSFFLLD